MLLGFARLIQAKGLSGTLPHTAGALRSIIIAGEHISGVVPSTFKLSSFMCGVNTISGSVSSEMGAVVEHFGSAGCRLSGVLPHFGRQIKSLLIGYDGKNSDTMETVTMIRFRFVSILSAI